MSTATSALLARRFRNLSTASLPPDFVFSTTSSKPSTSMMGPTSPTSPSKLRPMSAFLPLLPISCPENASPASSSCSSSSDAGDRDVLGCPESPDSDDGDAFSDVSEPTTPSEFDFDDAVAPEAEFSLEATTQLSPSTLAALQQRAFSLLDPTDVPHVLLTSRLLTLRDANPALCAGEAMALIEDEGAPVCWRARAGVYRAESLHALGLEEEARRELGYAEKMLRVASEERGNVFEETGHGLMEALVAWSIHVGKSNWGMYNDSSASSTVDGSEERDLPPGSAPAATTGLGISSSTAEQSSIPFPSQ